MLKFEYDSELLKIPKRFREASIQNINNKTLKMLATTYLESFDKYFKAGQAPSFFGTPGTGKTYTAACIANALNQKKVPVFWADTVTVFNNLMDYKDFTSQAYFKLKAVLTKTPIVVMDDFGQLRNFMRVRESFFEIVNARYASLLPTLFTANFSVADSWEEIGNCFGHSLARRIKLMSSGLVYSDV